MRFFSCCASVLDSWKGLSVVAYRNLVERLVAKCVEYFVLPTAFYPREDILV